MEENKPTKLCQFCDGNIAIDATECPFCGRSVLQSVETEEQEETLSHDAIADHYEPPYSPNRGYKMRESSEKTNIDDPFAEHKETFVTNEKWQQMRNEKHSHLKKDLFPIMCLSLGAQLCALGLLILIFSTDGKLILEWSSKSWLIYAVIGCPLLVIGRWLLRGKKDKETQSSHG